jgi:hypothetical protein
MRNLPSPCPWSLELLILLGTRYWVLSTALVPGTLQHRQPRILCKLRIR